MKFSDFEPGRVIIAGPFTVERQEQVSFAEQHDPQWFHTDADAAEHGRFGGLIASGWQTCAIATAFFASRELHLAEERRVVEGSGGDTNGGQRKLLERGF